MRARDLPVYPPSVQASTMMSCQSSVGMLVTSAIACGRSKLSGRHTYRVCLLVRVNDCESGNAI